MELECALLEYATVQRGSWRDQRRSSVRSAGIQIYLVKKEVVKSIGLRIRKCSSWMDSH